MIIRRIINCVYIYTMLHLKIQESRLVGYLWSNIGLIYAWSNEVHFSWSHMHVSNYLCQNNQNLKLMFCTSNYKFIISHNQTLHSKNRLSIQIINTYRAEKVSLICVMPSTYTQYINWYVCNVNGCVICYRNAWKCWLATVSK